MRPFVFNLTRWHKMLVSFFFFFNQKPYIINNWLFFNLPNFNKNKKASFVFFDRKKFLVSIFLLITWIKARVLYYTNNWVYTTNHKRIAVNYFWFVILAGIFGMVLATIIRLELAYPGVGIFAGDSLQYLSLVTAHGVIMVFFMIMPLIFGAFANFLLPTQLGVHDVAFPRLNSAAFWFLPGGLIMLGQLICVDRRYQRMNCFNIREIQALLKRRFFTDLINSHDHHDLNGSTMIGVRFKTSDFTTLNSNILLSYNYGIELNTKHRINVYKSQNKLAIADSLEANTIFFKIIHVFSSTPLNIFNNFCLNIFNNFWRLNSFYFVFQNLYVKINTTIGSFFNITYAKVYQFLLTLLSLPYFFFENLINFRVFNIFNTWINSSIYNIIDSFLKFFETYFYFYLKWINIKHYFYVLNLPYLAQIFFKNFSQLEFYNFLSLKIFFSINMKEFFFLPEFYEYSYLITIPNKKTNYLNYFWNFQIIYDVLFTFTLIIASFYYFFINFFENFKINYANYSNLIVYKDKPNTAMKHYWLNSMFHNDKPNYLNLTKPALPENLNFNSYTVYFYVLINIWLSIPIFIIQLITCPFNSKTLKETSHEFYEFLVTWYIPLVFNDDAYMLHYYLEKNENVRHYVFKIFSFFGYFLNLIYNFFYSIFDSFFTFIYSVKFLSTFYYLFNFFLLQFFSFFYFFFRDLITLLLFFLFNQKTFFIFNFVYEKFLIPNNNIIVSKKNNDFVFMSGYFNNINLDLQSKTNNQEFSSSSTRSLKFNSPVYKYDYKSGDYFPKLYKEIYFYLFSTVSDLVGAVKLAPWFFSGTYPEVFSNNFNNFYNNVIKTNTVNNFKIHQWNSSKFTFPDGFYNFFWVLEDDKIFLNQRWVSLNILNQKFYRMFHGSSMQQRIYTNWRQLKFTREAWRCKLLSARHQKTLYRRYVHEDGVFWSIERNAKDLLPGWAMITPFSARTRFTAIGKTDIGLMGVLLVLNSSIISAANFLVTYRYLSTLNNRKMRDARSFFTEGVMVASWMMVAANPMLIIGIIMLLSDRHWQTSFFDYSGGGDTVLFQHMFWFFGHPEVYIIMIPMFGFTNTLLSYYLKKRISARASLIYSMYTIAFLGFFVWGHHMYMVGLAHTTRMLFSTLTVMISVPAATKLMHWCVTIANSAFTFELPFLCILTFIFLFTSGGISGMCVAHTGMDILFHDTFYVIGHFHVMFAGAAMFASFGAFYFYFPAIFGVKYSRLFAYLHYIYYLMGQLMTVIPMFWLGYAGMPRRILDYPASLGGWHSVISAGHMLSVAGLIAFFIMIFDSLRQARAATRNTFGISRYNTRLNFYLYEMSRTLHVFRKGSFLFRYLRPESVKLGGVNYRNLEELETILLSYDFKKR